MTNYYEIRDRVPCEKIDALTVDAARVWLGRNGWTHNERVSWRHESGEMVSNSTKGRTDVNLCNSPYWKVRGIEEMAAARVVSTHVVIAEIREIVEWQKRCAEWVPPKEGEPCNCWECAQCRRSAVSCPTCSNKRCPRATDHRNGCSGSNEAGQEGSRYQ